jgi:metallopeptidase MepB
VLMPREVILYISQYPLACNACIPHPIFLLVFVMSTIAPSQQPVLFNGTPSTILDETQDLIDENIKLWHSLGQGIAPGNVTVENFIAPLLQNENHWIARRQILCFYGSISPIKDIRDASNRASTMFANAEVDLYLRDDIFRLAHSLLQRQERAEVQIESELTQFLRKFHSQFTRNGCGLPEGPERDSFREKLKQLKECERQFQVNLHEDKTGIWLPAEDLKGVPADFIQSLKRGGGDQEGRVWLPMKNALVNRVLEYAQKETTRRHVFTFQQNRLNEKNISLHRRIALLRDDLARCLGYRNHADFKVLERMIDSAEDITTFLKEIQAPLVLQGRMQVAKLLELKRAEINAQDGEKGRLYYWDRLYYERMLVEKEASVDFEAISEYFELHETLRRLMAIYGRIFDVKFELIDHQKAQELLGDNKGYLKPQEDVVVFMVASQSSDRFIGYIYFDFHPRDGKYSHAGHYGLQPVSRCTRASVDDKR